MPYSASNIIPLDSTTAFTTVLIDFLEGKRSDSLQNQFALMFQPNEYCYIKQSGHDPFSKDKCLEIRDIMNKRIVEEHSLINTHYRFNFAFFLEVQDLSDEMIDSILGFIKRMKLVLAAPGLQLYSYVFACKDNQDTNEAMEKFDRCSEKVLNNSEVEMPRLVLIDALPLSGIEQWIRAAVRSLNVLSRDNALSTSLRGMEKTVWNWTMTEFDVQAKEEEILKRRRIEEELHGTGEFPVGKLERNFRYIVDQFIDDQQKAFRFSADNIPIPANVIGGIFRKKSLQANIPAFAKVVEQSVYENIVKPVLQSIRNMDQDTLCLKLVQDIAVAEWPKIPQQLDAVSTSEKEIIIESIDDYPRRKINLDVQAKAEDMRTLINGEINRSVQNVKQFIPSYLKFILKQSIPAFVNGNAPVKTQELTDALRKLGSASIVAEDAQDYLRRLEILNNQAMAVSFTNIYSQSTFILISDDTYNLWQLSYAPVLSLTGCDVYNYHSLEEFEFQTLMLTTWRYEEYLKNRVQIFKQG